MPKQTSMQAADFQRLDRLLVQPIKVVVTN